MKLMNGKPKTRGLNSSSFIDIWGGRMDVEKRIERIEKKISIRGARVAELECEIEMLKKVRNKWKRVLTKAV